MLFRSRLRIFAKCCTSRSSARSPSGSHARLNSLARLNDSVREFFFGHRAKNHGITVDRIANDARLAAFVSGDESGRCVTCRKQNRRRALRAISISVHSCVVRQLQAINLLSQSIQFAFSSFQLNPQFGCFGSHASILPQRVGA